MDQPSATVQSVGDSNARLLGGAALLGAAAICSKLLGTLQKIPLQNMAGDGVFGIYNAVYPVYTFALVLAAAGFPVSASKFVAETKAAGLVGQARYLMRLSVVLPAAMGVVCFALLYGGAGMVAKLIGNEQTVSTIRCFSYGLLFAPILSALRGYLQGLNRMAPTAVSQVTEQLARVASMIAIVYYLVGTGSENGEIAAGAAAGSVVGVLAGLAVAWIYWHQASRREDCAGYGKVRAMPPTRGLTGRFIRYAFSVSLGLITIPLLQLVDTMTIPRLLVFGGMDRYSAMAHFGIYCRGLPLVQAVAMIAASMTASLIPGIAQAAASRNGSAVRARVDLSVRWTWLAGTAISVILAALATPINRLLFGDGEGSWTMCVLSASALFSGLAVVTGSILHGLGEEKWPAAHLLAAAMVKIVLHLWLVPLWGIAAAAVSTVVSFALISGFNLLKIERLLGSRHTTWRRTVLPSLYAALLTVACIGLLLACVVRDPAALVDRAASAAVVLISVLGGGFVYIWGLFRFGALDEAERAGGKLAVRKWTLLWKRSGL